MIALVDCKNFYASCERVFQPKYIGRPVVVLSNNDGCVIARSDEAKALGIEMGALAHEMEPFFNKHGVAVFSSNYTLYGDMSARVMHTLQGFAPEVEVYSIDEAFLDLSTFKHYDLEEYGAEMRRTVHQHTGIPVGVGIGATKALSKAANKYAKKVHGDKGLYVIDTEEKREMVLRWLPLGDIWGIGRRNQAYFGVQHGISTAWEFSQLNDEFVRQKMGVVGVRLLKELNGVSCIDMEMIRPPKQNICTSRSFPTNIADKSIIEQAVGTFITRCAEKLRMDKSCAGVISVFLYTNRFRAELKQHYGSLAVNIPMPTNNTPELMHYGMQAFNEIFKSGYLYKKVGVIVQDIVPQDQVQGALFQNIDRSKRSKLMEVLDSINGSMGQDKVRYAVSGYGREWKLRMEKLSQHYTTNWNEILKIKLR